MQPGLKDVVAASSRICFIDGTQGRLIYEGYDIRELAEHSTFEEVAYLLWYGQLPTRNQFEDLRHRLASLRDLPANVRAMLNEVPVDSSPMDVLRTAVSALALFEPSESLRGKLDRGCSTVDRGHPDDPRRIPTATSRIAATRDATGPHAFRMAPLRPHGPPRDGARAARARCGAHPSCGP